MTVFCGAMQRFMPFISAADKQYLPDFAHAGNSGDLTQTLE
jgi:hypothetical protein